MAEEFQTGVCGGGGGGGSWWNSARTNSFSPPCTAAALNETMIGGFGWSTAETIDINARSSDESASSIITDSSSIHAFSDIHKPPPPPTDSAAAATGGVLIDSTLQMMGYNLSSSSTSSDWNPTLLPGSGRGEVNFHSILQEDAAAAASSSRLSKYSHHEQKDWGGEEDSNMINPFKPINLNQLNFPPEHQRLISTPGSNSGDCAASFPMSSPPYGYSTSTFLPNMIEIDPQPQQSSSLYYPSSSTNANESFSFLKPSLPKMQPKNNFHFSNNTTFWNAPSNAAAPGLTDIRAGLFPPQPQPQLQPRFLAQGFEEKPNLTSASTAKPNNAQEVKKSSGETLFKRPRIETPSPLPTFKVRKEKLGDRITALQQLVSPFGKTDTASVLHEAIEYIKFLHDQVSVLSTPYMKNGAPMQFQQVNEKLKEGEGPKQDLRSRGLCLVPISSIFPVTNETTTDYWTPTFGGTFR